MQEAKPQEEAKKTSEETGQINSSLLNVAGNQPNKVQKKSTNPNVVTESAEPIITAEKKPKPSSVGSPIGTRSKHIAKALEKEDEKNKPGKK